MDHDLKNRLLLAERLSTERTQAQLPGLAPAANNLAAVAGADKSRGREKEGWAALGRITKTHAMALADQVVVSGASFLTLVAVGRMTSPTELGIYVLASSLLIWIVVAQDLLISLPYTFQQHRPLGTPAEQAGGALVYGCLLSAVITVILAVIALGASIIYAGSELPAIAWVLAAVVPFLSLRELGRRFAFAHLRLAEALILDIGVAAIQLGVLGGLAWSGGAVTHHGACIDRCGLRCGRSRMALPSAKEVCDSLGPVAENDLAELDLGNGFSLRGPVA